MDDYSQQLMLMDEYVTLRSVVNNLARLVDIQNPNDHIVNVGVVTDHIRYYERRVEVGKLLGLTKIPRLENKERYYKIMSKFGDYSIGTCVYESIPDVIEAENGVTFKEISKVEWLSEELENE